MIVFIHKFTINHVMIMIIKYVGVQEKIVIEYTHYSKIFEDMKKLMKIHCLTRCAFVLCSIFVFKLFFLLS